MKNWTMDLNTTNFRIAVSVVTTAAIALMLFTAVLFFGWEPTEKQMTVLYAVGGLLAVMQGLDVAQFIGKRFSDSGYRAAANASSSPGNTAITRTGDVTITNEPDAGKPVFNREVARDVAEVTAPTREATRGQLQPDD